MHTSVSLLHHVLSWLCASQTEFTIFQVLMSVAPMLQNLKRDLKKKPWNKSGALPESRGRWPKVSTSSKKGHKPRSTHLQKSGHYQRHLRWNRGKRICGGFRSINAHAEQERSESSWTGNCLSLQKPYNRYQSQCEVQTNDEATVYVYDLELFVTVQILEDTPAVPSLGKLCEDHGYSNEWASGQKPHLI